MIFLSLQWNICQQSATSLNTATDSNKSSVSTFFYLEKLFNNVVTVNAVRFWLPAGDQINRVSLTVI